MAVMAEGWRRRPERHTGVAAVAAVELAVHGCEMAKFGRVLPQPCFIRAAALETIDLALGTGNTKQALRLGRNRRFSREATHEEDSHSHEARQIVTSSHGHDVMRC